MSVRPEVDDAGAGPGGLRTVLLVGPLPPPHGGMANQTRQLAGLLAGEGLDVRLVRTNAPYRPAWSARVRGVRALVRLAPYVAALWRAARDADVVHVMANSGWSWHLFAAPAVWIAALRKTPVVVNYRGGEAREFFAREFASVRPTLARAQRIVVPSGFLREIFAERGFDAAVVPNVVDLARFRPAGAPPSTPRLVVARNLEPLYDVGTAVRAFARVLERYPEAELAVAGSGPERAALEALARTLGVSARVRFTGALDNASLPELYQAARVAINPSTADNMPISVLEALASGVPVVSTRVGGVPYLVRDGETALLVPPRDPEAMAGAVLRILDDPALASSLRDAGLESAVCYAWPHVRPRLLEVYEQAVAGAGRLRDEGRR